MDLSHLEHDTGDGIDTIEADNAHVLAGDDLDETDHNHSDVQQFGEATVQLVESGSPVVATPGEIVEIRMWVDIPEDTTPGDYNGNFIIVISENFG